MALTPVTLTVPDGLFAGMEMSVEWGGVNYNIAVPDGVGPGQEITVELPALEDTAPPATPGMTAVTLTVPEGTYAGMEMAVDWAGVTYNIAVPDGVGPGQEITVELPEAPSQAPELLAPEMAAMELAAPEAPALVLPPGLSAVAARYIESCHFAGEPWGSTSVGLYPFHTDGSFDLAQTLEGAPWPHPAPACDGARQLARRRP